MNRVHFAKFQSPVGPLLLAGNDRGLCLISFAAGGHVVHPQSGWMEDKKPFQETIRQLQAYFRGELREFDLPLALEGTPFQLCVWNSLCAIPYGQTISYGKLAHQIGQPNAARAVGLANGSNPIPIIVPCHRVIGSNANLTGYGGGLSIKQKLLSLESRQMRLL
ncbi:MAG TPA: methylated-DNA--[protein]-cysteine S-methyltransferase [Candidatus Acidoferrales bacterium]|nr:methylated-DNA--[protein]-cysteine S-methyltransferase [Candidatus Acidoferrales bacterium]